MKKIILFFFVSCFMVKAVAQPSFNTYTLPGGMTANWVSCIEVDPTGIIWAGSEDGFFKFNGSTWTRYTTANGLINNSVSSIAIDAQNNIWIGTWSGVSKFNGSTFTNYTTTNGLADTMVHSITIDANNNKWFGTQNGISKFNGSVWTTYTTSDGLPGNNISTSFKDAQGNVCFGISNYFVKYNGSTWSSISSPLAGISVITQDAVGNYWVGGTSGMTAVLYIFNGSTWALKTLWPCSSSSVTDIAIDNYQNAWVTTWGYDGIIQYTYGNNFIQYNYQTVPGWPFNSLNSVAIDSQGFKWIAVEAGVSGPGVIELDAIASVFENDAMAEKISVYPNPTSEVLFLNLGSKDIRTNVQIYDVAGHLVKEIVLGKKNEGIDISTLNAGSYLININYGSQSLRSTFIKD